MQLSPAQLEWIVSEVVRRLQSTAPAPQSAILSTAGFGGASRPHASRPVAGTRRLAIAGRLVTTATLRNRLEGITHLDVAATAVVTPAVIDLLRDHQIALVRSTSS